MLQEVPVRSIVAKTIRRAVTVEGHEEPAVPVVNQVGRVLREGLGDRDVRPLAAGQDRLETAAETRARTQDRATTGVLDMARFVDARATTVEVELQQRGVGPQVGLHGGASGKTSAIRIDRRGGPEREKL